jgi:hypothetical protein
MPHLIYTLSMALVLATAMALVGRRPFRERLYAAAYVFLCCAAAVFAGSWAMYWIHG